MKKIIFCSAITLFCFCACREIPKTKVVSDFVGIWQLCAQLYGEGMPTIEPYENKRLPMYKIICNDGTFVNMVMSRNTFITVYGTYDDSELHRYIEYVEKSYTNPNHNNYKNEMKCEMINGKYLKLTYQNQAFNRAETINEVNEVWVKVPCGNPFEKP